jgi:hypothetical protein
MPEKRSLESELPHSATTARDRARAHARAEVTPTTIDAILSTVSTWDTNFAAFQAPLDEDLMLRLELDTPHVRDYYIDTHIDHHLVLTQYCYSELNGTWYQFTDQSADLKMIETGEVVPVHVAVLFPTWTDGIIGEIAFLKPEWASQPFDLAQQMRLSRQLDAFDDGWGSGDLDAMLATVQDKTHSVIRVAEVNGDRRHRAVARTKDELRTAWGSPEAGRVLELERLHQSMTNWYVFASYRTVVELPDRKVIRETARTLPVGPGGQFIGELSYSMEMEI